MCRNHKLMIRGRRDNNVQILEDEGMETGNFGMDRERDIQSFQRHLGSLVRHSAG